MKTADSCQLERDRLHEQALEKLLEVFTVRLIKQEQQTLRAAIQPPCQEEQKTPQNHISQLQNTVSTH